MKIDARRPKHLLLLALQCLYTWVAIFIRPLVKPPHKPLVILYGHQFSGNLRALYREWELHRHAELDMYFLTLDPEQGKRLAKEGVQCLRCDRLRDMQALAKVSVIVSDHGLHLMTPLIRFTSIKFIDVWHGIPFKGFDPDDFRLQHRYHEVWVSSELLKQLYVEKFGFRPDQVVPLGYARTDQLFTGTAANPAFRREAAIPADSRLVLYAPTWQQDDRGRELFPFGEKQDDFLRHLSDICTAYQAILIIRSHLNAQISDAKFKNVRYCSMRDYPDTESLLQQSDVLICDWSSIAFDYLALNRPTIFLEVEPPFSKGFSLGPEYRFGSIVSDMSSLATSLEKALSSPSSYEAKHCAAHRDITEKVYGGNTDGKAASRQLERLCKLMRADIGG